jgi:transposase-like protein
MTPISFKRRRFSPVIIQHVVWLYARLTLSFRDVEELLAERCIDVSNESVRRCAPSAGRLLRKLLKNQALAPKRITTDKLKSSPVAIRNERLCAVHDQGLRTNNRVENSHQPVRRRERKQQRFKSPGSAQRFLSIHAAVQDALYVQRHLLSRGIFKTFRAETFAVRQQSCLAA